MTLHVWSLVPQKTLVVPEKIVWKQFIHQWWLRGDRFALWLNWKIIYLCKLCYLLHAMNVEDGQVRFFFFSWKLCAVLGFAFKKLLPYFDYFSISGPEFHYWYDSEMVATWAWQGCFGSEMDYFLCYRQYITYRNKRKTAFTVYRHLLLSIPTMINYTRKCYLCFGGFQSLP